MSILGIQPWVPMQSTAIKKQSYIRFATATLVWGVLLAGLAWVGRRGGISCGPFSRWAGIWKRCQMFTANCDEWQAVGCRWATAPGKLAQIQPGILPLPEGADRGERRKPNNI
jgi:hypothetical protein